MNKVILLNASLASSPLALIVISEPLVTPKLRTPIIDFKSTLIPLKISSRSD